MTTDEILAVLSIKGFAKAEHIAEVFDVAEASAEAALSELENAGLITASRLGAKLTDAGKDSASRLCSLERHAAAAGEVEAAYARFDPINAEFKACMTRWQTRPGPAGDELNDHSDADYDAVVIRDIAATVDKLEPVLASVASSCPRFEMYTARFARALARVDEGEQRYVAAPIADSIHTVWFELHEDLIRLSGRTRADEAAAGRAV